MSKSRMKFLFVGQLLFLFFVGGLTSLSPLHAQQEATATPLPPDVAAQMTVDAALALTATAQVTPLPPGTCPGFGKDVNPNGFPVTGNVNRPSNAIDVSLIYAPESDLYMPYIIEQFNRDYAQGINPLTQRPLGAGERPIFITGEVGNSGEITDSIANAVLNPDNPDFKRPAIFQPSVRHWLTLVNFKSGQMIFDVRPTLDGSPGTALAPVVIAIWESRLELLKRISGKDTIGWADLLAILKDGWPAGTLPEGRTAVYFGHTDPFVSSTGLSTLIMEFYAAARFQVPGFNKGMVDQQDVDNERVKEFVRDIELLIRHYSRRTTEFKEYIAQGPGYLDFVPLEENDLLAINLGLTRFRPPERLVALYPEEGTFWHDHPMAIVNNVPWVTAEQQIAARTFIDYVIDREKLNATQSMITSCGFRPVNDTLLGSSFTAANGVDPNQPERILEAPSGETINAIQDSWNLVRKPAEIVLVIDISDSMNGVATRDNTKLELAIEAALRFVETIDDSNRLSVVVFNDNVQTLVPLDYLTPQHRQMVEDQISSLVGFGKTNLYGALRDAVDVLSDLDDRGSIRAVVLLSDGRNDVESGTTTSLLTLDDVLNELNRTSGKLNPVIIFPIAYGQDADLETLNRIADANALNVQRSEDPTRIIEILENLANYFGGRQ